MIIVYNIIEYISFLNINSQTIKIWHDNVAMILLSILSSRSYTLTQPTVQTKKVPLRL